MKKIDKRIPVIIILLIIEILLCYFYFKNDVSEIANFNGTQVRSEEITEKTSYTIQTNSEIKSALTEDIELHATFYLSECYASVNQLVKEGENILKYTNGTYLVAPYDCIINSIDIPDTGSMITNSNKIEISSINVLKVTLNVSESQINKFSLGDKAIIKVSALDNKEYNGYVTEISNSASNGKFTMTIEFYNDGNVYLGMTGNVSI